MKKHIWRIATLLVVLSMLIAACGPTTAPEPTEEPAAPTEAPKVEPTEAPKEEPTTAPAGGPVDATPGETVNMTLLPKFLGILVFDQANQGAEEAHGELQNKGELQFLGPTPENSVAGQIEIVTTAATQGMDAIMISNNAGDQIAPAAQAARDAGMTVVTWDSPIPSAEGEQVFVAQVDFDETGTVMADMALSILGDDGGKFAVLSASPDAANQNAWIAALEEVLETNDKYASLELLDIVYGNDQSEDSYNQALALVDKYPDMELIMAPTTVGIAAAAKAMQDEGLCDTVKVSGLGLPAEMVSYTLNGCAPEFALWSFVDLGYLTYYVSYLLVTGAIEGAEGESFNAGRMGTYTIEKDPTRDAGLRVLMGPFKVYDASNVEEEAGPQEQAEGTVVQATPGQAAKMVLLPKFLGILVFDQADQGAQEAHSELQNPEELQFLGPTPENSVAGQIEIVTTAATQGMDAIMISNNAGDQIAPAAQAARDAGMTVVTWDSPIPSAEGEQVFVAQVDFDETGTVMADMALSILGDDGGKFAVLSASPDAANQNAWIAALEEVLANDATYASLELLDIVYGNDQSEDSYNQALALVDKYPDMELIMAPTTVGIAAAAKAMQDEGLCDTVKVSGLGLPAEMVSYTLNGCAPEFALWSFVDLGYLTYYVSYLLATGAIEGTVGERFDAGRMGTYTIEKDPTRDAGLRVLMGPFKVYDASNVEVEAGPQEQAEGTVVQATPGEELDLVLLPKFLGILVFDQANNGAEEAHAELQNPGELQFLGPTPENSVAGQIEIVTTAATQGQDGIMISNNAGDQIAPAAQAARDAGLTVVTWDSPIPSAEGEQIFVAQVDFDETGEVMADMALSILGDDGGKFAVLSASPDAANQNAWIAALEEVLANDATYASLELLDIVYGNDQSEDSYNQALALVDKYPDMELIMAPTTVGIAAAAKAMQDEGLCDTVKVSGLGLPAEMVSYTLNGCAPEFALWSFVDLGYLTYYVTYLLASGAIEGTVGERFEAGRMGTYTIEKDPTRDAGLRVLMGPFTVYNKDNVEEAAE